MPIAADENVRLRGEYPRRREFSNWRMLLGKAAKFERWRLNELGFRIEAADTHRPL